MRRAGRFTRTACKDVLSRSERLPVWVASLAAAYLLGSAPAPLAQAAQAPLNAPARSTTSSPDIHYVPTPQDVVDAMLDMAKLTASDVIYDLGSGDGRVVITAAQRYGAHGVGIEIDRALVETATSRARKAGVADKVRFETADLFKTDLSPATVVALYLSPSINLRLKPKLLRELRPGSRIVSHRFDMGDWMPEREATIGGRHVMFWTVPPR